MLCREEKWKWRIQNKWSLSLSYKIFVLWLHHILALRTNSQFLIFVDWMIIIIYKCVEWTWDTVLLRYYYGVYSLYDFSIENCRVRTQFVAHTAYTYNYARVNTTRILRTCIIFQRRNAVQASRTRRTTVHRKNFGTEIRRGGKHRPFVQCVTTIFLCDI